MSSNAEQRLRTLEKLYLNGVLESNGEVVSIETLQDVFLLLYNECHNSTLRREKSVSDFLEYARPIAQKIKVLRLRRDDFETLKVIGRGAFGEVAVVRLKNTDKIFAMKLLNKWEMLKRAETACFIEERDVLVKGDDRWITHLHYSFQDDDYLYFVMDYYSGGDLLTLLSKFEDRLPEDMARFYIAEMVLAIDSIHQLQYVHRDIKPDNVLLDQHGHIRLADFGSCLKMQEDGSVQSNVAVGTPDYISPEILRAMEDGQGRYGPECDWWSLGVCMFEMLFGETPFYAESLVETYSKIMNHKDQFVFPPDIDDVSDEAMDLIKKLICNADQRLGINGLEDFKNHPFFTGIDWINIREMSPPYKPDVKSPTDTSNFDVDETDLKQSETVPPNTHAAFTGNHLPFVGFSFTRNSCLSDMGSLLEAKDDVISDGVDSVSAEAYERRIKRLESEKNTLSHRLSDTAKRGGGSVGAENNEVKHLKDEIALLSKKMSDAQMANNHLEKELQEALGMRKDDEDKNSKIRQLEKQNRTLKAEREEFQREQIELQEKLKQQGKELKEAKSQYKLTMQEFSEINERLSDVRSQKTKLTRDLRDREEEYDAMSHKVEVQRLDLRKADKVRKELETDLDEKLAELNKEKFLRQQSEQSVKQREEELERVRKRGRVDLQSSTHDPKQQEITRLKAELEKKRSSYEEGLSKEKSRHTIEEKGLKETISENEQQIISLKREVSSLNYKLSRETTSSQSQQDDLESLRRKLEREKSQLDEENRRLTLEVDKMSTDYDNKCRELKIREEELREMSDKDKMPIWEAQISELIQWVSDEKDARGYLQALALKMTEELEGVKKSGLVGAARQKDWQSRRSQKMDKMELLNLQSNLQSEVHAKDQINKELSKVKSDQVQAEKKLKAAEARNKELENKVEALEKQVKEMEQKLDDYSSQPMANKVSSHLSFLDEILNTDIKEYKLEDDVNEEKYSETYKDEVDQAASPKPVATVTPVMPVQPKPKPHKFVISTFSVPLKCAHCTSLMLGRIRQGVRCEVCQYACHVACSQERAHVCPIPPDQIAKPLGIDPNRGIGTAYEGVLKIPKPGGVRKGWMRQFAVVCDFKLFLFDMMEGKSNQSNLEPSHIIDMRDEDFQVSTVKESDVIHADRKDVPCIFKVAASQLNPPGLTAQFLLLASSENDKKKWVNALNELHRILRRNKRPEKPVFLAKEVCDPSMPLIKMVHCADIVDYDRFLLGTDEGLYCLQLSTGYITRVDNKKIFHVEIVPTEQLIIVISGRGRHVRLIPILALDQEANAIKVEEPKGSTLFTTGRIRQGSTMCMCVAMKRHVLVYEFNRTKLRHRKIKELTLPAPCSTLEVFQERLCAGYTSGFSLFSIQGEGQHIQPLLNVDDPSLSYLQKTPVDALAAVQISNKEYLLCFMTVGVYVDYQGRRTRKQELMWPAVPTAICFNYPYLVVYSEVSVDMFEVSHMEWFQTIPIKGTHPLTHDGSFNLCYVTDLHTPRLMYLHNNDNDGAEKDDLVIPHTNKQNIKRDKGRFSFKNREEIKKTKDRKSMISGPSDFNHITHMGPGDGMQMLKDLPQRKIQLREEKQSGRDFQRVRSMFQPMGPGLRTVPSSRERASSMHSAGRGDVNGSSSLMPTSPGVPGGEGVSGGHDGGQRSYSDESPPLSSHSPRHSLGSSSSTPPTPHRTSVVEPDQLSGGSGGWDGDAKGTSSY
ncbi:serine/threonine-protein kinase MRCK alpha-like isoform X2 [Patiria miniata]|uniref:non-specific serine/threonine protein kinase n=1 Tax=Patiria miniata TaxID=46514 RepID=A0A914B6D1_PATMI|nr:serine/threonine-protein kinase MRCK alpha-like isoform X2 [Patiria miniata]